MTTRNDLTVFRGTAATITCPAAVPPVNISGWSLTFMVKLNYADVSALISKSVGAGVTITDPANGTFVVTLSAADTTLTPADYWWSVYRTDSGSQDVLVWGEFHVRPNEQVP